MPMPYWLKVACVRSGLARFLPVTKRYFPTRPDFIRRISDRLLAAPVEELAEPATFPEFTDGIDLADAAPDFGLANSLRIPRSSTDGAARLRSAVLADSANIGFCATTGVTAGYAAVLDAFVNPGDGVALFDPTPPLFHLGAKSRRATLRWIPSWTDDGRMRFLSAGLSRALRGAKLLLLANPSIPTGGRISPGDWEEIAWQAKRAGVIVVTDESLNRCPIDETEPTRPTFDTEIRLDSLSLGFGLRDLRIGWATGHAELIRAVELAVVLSGSRPSRTDMAAAAELLERDPSFLEPQHKGLRERRDYAIERLQGMGLAATRPAAGASLWVSVASWRIDGRTFAARLLREQGVLVTPGTAYGPSGNHFIRIAFGRDDGRLRAGLTKLGAFMESLQPIPQNSKVETAPAPKTEPETEPSFSRV